MISGSFADAACAKIEVTESAQAGVSDADFGVLSNPDAVMELSVTAEKGARDVGEQGISSVSNTSVSSGVDIIVCPAAAVVGGGITSETAPTPTGTLVKELELDAVPMCAPALESREVEAEDNGPALSTLAAFAFAVGSPTLDATALGCKMLASLRLGALVMCGMACSFGLGLGAISTTGQSCCCVC